MASAVYPGSFDPVHNGHLDIISRASRLFDELSVAVYQSPQTKRIVFSTDDRMSFIKKGVKDLPNVEVVSFDGLATDLAREVSAGFIVRGLRAGIDFETESEMALMWRHLDPTVDVVSLMSALEYQFVYSSRIKEVAALGGDVKRLVPTHVADALSRHFS